METEIRFIDARITFKHLILLAIALSLGRRSVPSDQSASPQEPAATDTNGRPAVATRAPAHPRGWKDLLVDAWREAGEDNVSLAAAGVAFYGFLALVPLLGAVVLIYGLLASPEDLPRHMRALAGFLPAEASRLVAGQMDQVVHASSGKKGVGLLVALGVALFGSRSAAGGLISSLNIAYDEEERRGFIKTNLIALAITAAAACVVAVVLAGVVAFGSLHLVLPHLGGALRFALTGVTWIVLGLLAAAAAASLYRYGPSRGTAQWRWITPGTVLFSAGWIVLTGGLGLYAASIGHYNATYGSLAGVVVLLTWLYLSAWVLLFGAEVNAELEQRDRRR